MDICDVNLYLDCKVRLWLWRTIPAVQIVFGTIGNILNVVILLRKRMKKIPTSVFLMCLSLADIGTLWALPLPKISKIIFDVDIRVYSEVLCGPLVMISFAVGGFSKWLLVILTMERVVMTRFPTQARSKLTRKKSLIIALGTLMMTSLFSCHNVFGFKIHMISVDSSNGTTDQLICLYLPKYSSFYETTWRFAVLTFYTVIPAAFIILGNAVIILSLLQQKKKFAAVTPGGDCHRTKRYMSSKETSATKLIVVISACFLLTTIPQNIKRVLSARRKPTDEAGEARRLLLDDCILMLHYCNFSLNFLLYFVSGSVFKQEWKTLVAELCSKFRTRVPDHQTSTMTASTMRTSLKNTHSSAGY